MSDPEIIVKFWPPSITAKGAKAIEAVRKPLAFTLYAKPVVAVALGLMAVWSGYDCLGGGIRVPTKAPTGYGAEGR